MHIHNSAVRTVVDWTIVVWSGARIKEKKIDKIEGIQQNFTSKIKGLEQMDYQ